LSVLEALRKRLQKSQPTFEIVGLLTREDDIYPLGTDTKVLGTVFELLIRPYIYDVAKELGLMVKEPDRQNYYPDFTLMVDESDPAKTAVDVKTTYRDFRSDGTWRAKFTLGGFASFLRGTGDKNIVYPYSQYGQHLIVGFIYTRNDSSTSVAQSLADRDKVTSPFKDVEVFVQEKYRIAGEKPGSGNTENIGSIEGSSLDDFVLGKGPFAELGEETFLDYWRNYPRYRTSKAYNDLASYFKWKKTQAKE